MFSNLFFIPILFLFKVTKVDRVVSKFSVLFLCYTCTGSDISLSKTHTHTHPTHTHSCPSRALTPMQAHTHSFSKTCAHTHSDLQDLFLSYFYLRGVLSSLPSFILAINQPFFEFPKRKTGLIVR